MWNKSLGKKCTKMLTLILNALIIKKFFLFFFFFPNFYIFNNMHSLNRNDQELLGKTAVRSLKKA